MSSRTDSPPPSIAALPLKDLSVPERYFAFDGHTVVCNRGWLRTAKLFDEVWLPQPTIAYPGPLIEAVRTSDLGADLFTFAQVLPDVTPRHPYHLDFDNIAVADTTDFARWWNGLPQESRKNVRKAQKRGVTTLPVAFTDELVAGIKRLYDETPVRQGRRFAHYGKELAVVKRENATYLDRSQFFGAFLGTQLIGFMKIVYTGSSARIMQILASEAHCDKHPTNALLAAAMELCAKKPVAWLLYGQYVYGNKRSSSVTEFKRRNGFYEMMVPRYYVPFTLKGRIAIAAGHHRGLVGLVPEPLLNAVLGARALAYRNLPRRSPPQSMPVSSA